MRLVSSVVLGAESPVHVWKHGLLFEVYRTEYAAAYFESLLSRCDSREKRRLSAFSTFLAKKHGDFYLTTVKIMDKAPLGCSVVLAEVKGQASHVTMLADAAILGGMIFAERW
jgi:hypothetical protein